MIDWKRVDELRSEIGDDAFPEVVELFMDEVEGVIMRLRSAPPPESYESDLHFLKGSAWNLGFSAFGAACQVGERQAATGRGHMVDIAGILASYSASKAAFMARATEYGLSSAA